jgi:hypothetical protein
MAGQGKTAMSQPVRRIYAELCLNVLRKKRCSSMQQDCETNQRVKAACLTRSLSTAARGQ